MNEILREARKGAKVLLDDNATLFKLLRPASKGFMELALVLSKKGGKRAFDVAFALDRMADIYDSPDGWIERTKDKEAGE